MQRLYADIFCKNLKAGRCMRVFHLITHFDLGGAERVAANIAESATPGIHYHVVEIMRGNSAYTPRLIDELRSANVHIHRSVVPDINWHFLVQRIAALLFPLRLLYIILRWRPDVIHSHTETPDLALYVASLMLPKRLFRNVRIVRTIHNTRLWTGLDGVGRRVEAFYRRHDASIAISHSVRNAYAERYGVEAPIIHNGVAEEMHPQTFEPLMPDRINILFAGRLEPQKGVSTLCEVLKRLAADQRYFFTIAGDGTQRQLVEQTISSGGVDGAPLTNARLLPPVFSLASYMSSFDYLFMPSEFEGLSMLSMEASINRLPVIANRAPGLSDTLPNDWPLMVSDNNVDDWAALFGSYLPTVNRQQLADKAHSFAVEHFSVRKMQERYEEVYNK